MTTTRASGGPSSSAADLFPTKHLPRPEVRELPKAPANTWRIIGPGIIAAGVGLASGEFILFPYIDSQVGLVFVWAALVGLVTQFFINMEIERYTLATGETALTGFSRYWRHWGLFFAVMTYFANLWPGWALSSATQATYLWGGSANWIGFAMLVAIRAILTLAPVVYAVWGLVALGSLIILVGFDQPLVLVVISACVGGVMMFIYSGLLILVNRRILPDEIRIRGFRVGAMGWSVALFGVLSVLTIYDQVKDNF